MRARQAWIFGLAVVPVRDILQRNARTNHACEILFFVHEAVGTVSSAYSRVYGAPQPCFSPAREGELDRRSVAGWVRNARCGTRLSAPSFPARRAGAAAGL